MKENFVRKTTIGEILSKRKLLREEMLRRILISATGRIFLELKKTISELSVGLPAVIASKTNLYGQVELTLTGIDLPTLELPEKNVLIFFGK